MEKTGTGTGDTPKDTKITNIKKFRMQNKMKIMKGNSGSVGDPIDGAGH